MKTSNLLIGGGIAAVLIYLLTRTTTATTSTGQRVSTSPLNQLAAAMQQALNGIKQQLAALTSALKQQQQAKGGPSAGGLGGPSPAPQPQPKPRPQPSPFPSTVTPGVQGIGPLSQQFMDFMQAWQVPGTTLSDAAASAGISNFDAIKMVTGVDPTAGLGGAPLETSDLSNLINTQFTEDLTSQVTSLPNTTDLGTFLSGSGAGGFDTLSSDVGGGTSGGFDFAPDSEMVV